MSYVLHYAPDNASLIVRLALDHLDVPYETTLVDRRQQAQRSPDYLKLNPNGLIPTLETPQGPLFETAAILLWLNDTHGGLGPAPDSPHRGAFLKWLFFLSNTVHPLLRMTFYPDKYIRTEEAQAALRQGVQGPFLTHLRTLDTLAAEDHAWFSAHTPSALTFYVAGLLRWPAIYPAHTDRTWYDLTQFPRLHAIATALEELPCMHRLTQAEGLGSHPITRPQPANPPQGSAL